MKKKIILRQKDSSTKKTFLIVGLMFLIGVGMAAVILFVGSIPRLGNSAKPIVLKGVEVEEYQGENLSAIADFRENSIKGPQYIDISKYVLNIDGLVDKKLSLTYGEVLKFDSYKKVVKLNCVEGWSVNILWEGVLLKDLLMKAGIKTGSNTVIFTAYDGYSSSLPLDYILDNKIILAYKMNGVEIPPERGFPFMVVAESKWGYKWVKWVTGIEVSSDKNYKGYWEKSGYNQNGDVNGPKFEE